MAKNNSQRSASKVQHNVQAGIVRRRGVRRVRKQAARGGFSGAINLKPGKGSPATPPASPRTAKPKAPACVKIAAPKPTKTWAEIFPPKQPRVRKPKAKKTTQSKMTNRVGIKKIGVPQSPNRGIQCRQSRQDRQWAEAGYTRAEAQALMAIREEQNRIMAEIRAAKGEARRYWAEQLKRAGGSHQLEWLLYKATRRVPLTATFVAGAAA